MTILKLCLWDGLVGKELLETLLVCQYHCSFEHLLLLIKWFPEKETLSYPGWFRTGGSNVHFPSPEMKWFLGTQFAAQVWSPAQKGKCTVHGRQNFLPVDIHKAALWKQKPLTLFIVLWLLLWQPEANSLCSDWHTLLLFISWLQYSDAFCAPCSLLLCLWLFYSSLAFRSSSPTAFQNRDKQTCDFSP